MSSGTDSLYDKAWKSFCRYSREGKIDSVQFGSILEDMQDRVDPTSKSENAIERHEVFTSFGRFGWEGNIRGFCPISSARDHIYFVAYEYDGVRSTEPCKLTDGAAIHPQYVLFLKKNCWH